MSKLEDKALKIAEYLSEHCDDRMSFTILARSPGKGLFTAYVLGDKFSPGDAIMGANQVIKMILDGNNDSCDCGDKKQGWSA